MKNLQVEVQCNLLVYTHTHKPNKKMKRKKCKPFTLTFASESPIQDLKGSGIKTFSSNLVDKMLKTFFLATATDVPFTHQSTSQRNRLKQETMNAKIKYIEPTI